MPLVQGVKTLSAEHVWTSPDGQRTINKVTLEYQGKQFSAKTYSKAIATVGWSGDVETEEKAGRNGPETFVKQPQKAGGWAGGKGGKPAADPHTMYTAYAKDIAVALIAADKWSSENFAETVAAVSEAGTDMFNARPGAEQAEQPAQKATPSLAEAVSEAFPDAVVEEGADQPLSIDDLPDV